MTKNYTAIDTFTLEAGFPELSAFDLTQNWREMRFFNGRENYEHKDRIFNRKCKKTSSFPWKKEQHELKISNLVPQVWEIFPKERNSRPQKTLSLKTEYIKIRSRTKRKRKLEFLELSHKNRKERWFFFSKTETCTCISNFYYKLQKKEESFKMRF